MIGEPASALPLDLSQDPWNDARWKGVKWTIYRDVAYDLTNYFDAHPGGSFLLRLAVGRDCTALFESYHLIPEKAVGHLKRLPVLTDFPVNAVPRSPRPSDSEIYRAIRERVRKEIFKGTEIKGAHRSGTEGATLAVLGYAALAYALYASAPSLATGAMLGLAGAWIGLTIQHCGNHGAMSTNPTINLLLGSTDDLIGGSSLMWRYHHGVSHHIHCNDDALDEDVFSSMPFLRFDARQPRKWFHQYQHVYMWALLPMLSLVFQVGDLVALAQNRTAGATLFGASVSEKLGVLAGKVAHYSLLIALPWALHGGQATLEGLATYLFTQSIVLATTFAVSHNLEENKPVQGGSPTTTTLTVPATERDWGMQQIQTSSNWGGVIGNFFTGGLNLQIEHHLFPAIAFLHYPAISKIVREEAEKRGIEYVHYDTLPEILGRYVAYMRTVGSMDNLPQYVSSVPGSAVVARL